MGSVAHETHEYELMLQFSEALVSSLDLRVALDRAVPLLQALVQVDHVALAISRPGSLYDYEWYNTTLPSRFLGDYAQIADHDFVRHAVAASPNVVVRDEQMISRRALHRHVIYEHARAAGARLEHVMAVMLSHQRDWSSGLSLYRSRACPFSAREAALLQRLVPQIKHAVSNARQHEALVGQSWLEPAVHTLGMGVAWLDQRGRELARTARVTSLIAQYFPALERKAGRLPQRVVEHLLRHIAIDLNGKAVPELVLDAELSRLHIAYVYMAGSGRGWALIFRPRGLAPELQALLSPRLVQIAGCVLRGMSNEAIARRDGRSLATIKQQVSEVYARLGVQGRKGLIRLTSGYAE